MKIFFDVDGVIIDGWHADPAKRRPWDATLEEDLGINREAFQQALFSPQPDGSPEPYLACVSGQADLRDVLAEILPQLGYSGSVETLLAYWFGKDSNLNAAVVDAIEHLGRQSGVSLYLATNQEHHRATHLWTELRLKDLFEDMFHSARVGTAKQDPNFFFAVGKELGIQTGEVPLFFDDTQSVINAAREAGWDGQLFASVDDILCHQRLAHFFTSKISVERCP